MNRPPALLSAGTSRRGSLLLVAMASGLLVLPHRAAADPSQDAELRAADGEVLPNLNAEAGRDLTGLHRLLNSPRTPFDPVPEEDGKLAFTRFVKGVLQALQGAPELQAEVNRRPARWRQDVRELLVRGYMVRVDAPNLAPSLSELVRLRTVGGAADRSAFSAFDRWLEAKTRAFGLKLRRHAKGALYEVSLGRGRKAIGMVTHVDVTNAPEEGWTHGPWSGHQAGRKVWGRGTRGGKAGVVTMLYAMKALRDSGVKLKRRIVLLVETNRFGGAYALRNHLKRNKAPLWTWTAGESFPPIVGEQGIANIRFSARPGKAPDAGAPGWKIVSVRGNRDRRSGKGEAQAIVNPRELAPRRAIAALRRNLTLFKKKRPDVDVSFEEAGPNLAIRIRATGAKPNDPGVVADLVVFLADYLGVFPDHRGRLLRFLSQQVGLDTDGKGLGVHYEHTDMAPTRILMTTLEEKDAKLHAELDLRWPLSATSKTIRKAIKTRVRGNSEAGSIDCQVQASEPWSQLGCSEDGDFPETLYTAYQEVTGKGANPRTVQEATLARWVPGAITFGPGPAGNPPQELGVKNESISFDDLEKACRVYITALVRLAMR